MSTQVDFYGFTLTMLKSIIEYQNDESVAILKAGMYDLTCRVQKRARKLTGGWSLLVKWADKSYSWMPLKDMKA